MQVLGIILLVEGHYTFHHQVRELIGKGEHNQYFN